MNILLGIDLTGYNDWWPIAMVNVLGNIECKYLTFCIQII